MSEREAIIQLECEATSLQGMMQEGGKAGEFAKKRVKALDMAIEALEKQLAKRVIIKPWCPAECPTCGQTLSEHLGDGYYKHSEHLGRCPNDDCGQRLKWEE